MSGAIKSQERKYFDVERCYLLLKLTLITPHEVELSRNGPPSHIQENLRRKNFLLYSTPCQNLFDAVKWEAKSYLWGKMPYFFERAFSHANGSPMNNSPSVSYSSGLQAARAEYLPSSGTCTALIPYLSYPRRSLRLAMSIPNSFADFTYLLNISFKLSVEHFELVLMNYSVFQLFEILRAPAICKDVGSGIRSTNLTSHRFLTLATDNADWGLIGPPSSPWIWSAKHSTNGVKSIPYEKLEGKRVEFMFEMR